MRRKCRYCLCRTCIKSCYCHDCDKKIKECKKYSGFKQLNIFESHPETKYHKAPRYSWEYYGISNDRYKILTEYIQSGKYSSLVSQAAYLANKDIAEYILLSVIKGKSYDELQKKWELKEIKRMPCCRTDFYGIRRYFYHLFDKELKKRKDLREGINI